MLRIGLDIRESRQPTGVGRYIRELVEGLQRDRRFQLYVFHDGGREGLPYCIEPNVRFISWKTTRAYLWEQWWLPTVLAKHRIPLYHATNNFGVPWRYPGRKVLTIHDTIPFSHPEVIADPIRRCRVRAAVRIDARIANVILTDSRSSRADIMALTGIPPAKIRAIWPVSLPPSSGRPSGRRGESAPPQCVPGGGKYILHNGGVDPRKNIPRLLSAFRQVTRDGRVASYHLVITGNSATPYGREMQDAARRMELTDKVVFTGAVDPTTMRLLLDHAVFSIYPSLYEGFGLPVIEAMSAGIPVIAANTSSLPEVAGGAALLVDPLSTDEIARAISDLCLRPRLRSDLADRGRQWLAANAGHNMVTATSDSYCEMLR